MNRHEEYLDLMKELEENAPDLGASVRKARSKRSRIAFVYRPLAGLAACFALFVLLVNFSAPVAYACSQIPFLHELAEAVTFSKSLSDAVEHDYVQPMNLVQKNNGVTAEIEYVIVDRRQVHVFYRLHSEKYKNMDVTPQIWNKEGTDKEPCAWRTPINDVPNEDLRLITLDYLEQDVPNSLRVMIYAFDGEDHSSGKEHPIAEFNFLLEFDPNRIAKAKIYPIHQTVVMDGQTITISEVQVYPTHLRVYLEDAAQNTAWLEDLEYYIETEKGRFDPVFSGTSTALRPDSKSKPYYQADSIYFYEAQEIRLVITGARWLSKDLEKIRIDLETGEAACLPEGVTLVPPDAEHYESPVTVHVHWDQSKIRRMILSGVYYDAHGTQQTAPPAARDCYEHDGSCWYEWLPLEDYPYDQIWFCPTYSHGWQAEEPITIPVQ